MGRGRRRRGGAQSYSRGPAPIVWLHVGSARSVPRLGCRFRVRSSHVVLEPGASPSGRWNDDRLPVYCVTGTTAWRPRSRDARKPHLLVGAPAAAAIWPPRVPAGQQQAQSGRRSARTSASPGDGVDRRRSGPYAFALGDHRVLRVPCAGHAGVEDAEAGQQGPAANSVPDATAPSRVRRPRRSARRPQQCMPGRRMNVPRGPRGTAR